MSASESDNDTPSVHTGDTSDGSDAELNFDEVGGEVDLEGLLTSDEGDTIPQCLLEVNETLGGIERQMAITNKLLVKFLQHLRG